MDNNMTMALLSDLGGLSPPGGFRRLAGGATGNQEGSLFQQMINQMLAGNGQAAEGESAAEGNLNQSDFPGDGLFGSLLTGDGKAGIWLMNSAAMMDASEKDGVPGEKSAAEDGEALQAMMAALAGASVLDSQKVILEAGTSNQGIDPQALAAAEAMKAGVLAGPGGGQHMANHRMADGRSVESAAADGLAILSTGGSSSWQSEMTLQRAGSAAGATGTQAGQENGELWNGGAGQVNGEENGLVARETIPISLAKGDGKTSSGEAQPFKPVADGDFAGKAESEIQMARQGVNELGIPHHPQGAAVDMTNGNTLTQPVEESQSYGQIRDEILTRLERNGPTEFKMQLEPAELGQIDIKLKLSEGKLMIDILAANAKTHALLISQIDKLISGLGLQNVQVESVQVSQQMSSHTQDNSQSQSFLMNSAMDFSQRKQQEQLARQFTDGGQGGAFGLSQEELQVGTTVSRTGSIPYDSHRMNYTV